MSTIVGPTLSLGIDASGATAGAREFKLAITIITESGKGAVDSVDKVSNSISKLKSPIDKAIDAFSNLKTAIGSLAAVMLVKQVVELSDKYTSLNSRLRLTLTATQDLATVQNDLFKISQNTTQSYESTVTLYTRLARSTKELGVGYQELLQFTESVNQALIVGGSSAEESSSALLQLGQALASGVLRGDEFNSIMENAPRLSRAMADGLGVTIGQLRQLASQGSLTAETVIRAIQSQSSTLQYEYQSMEKTIGGALQQLDNSFEKIFTSQLQSADASRTLVSALNELKDQVESPQFSAGIGLIAELFGEAAKEVANLISLLGKLQSVWSWYLNGIDSLYKAVGIDTKAVDATISSLYKSGTNALGIGSTSSVDMNAWRKQAEDQIKAQINLESPKIDLSSLVPPGSSKKSKTKTTKDPTESALESSMKSGKYYGNVDQWQVDAEQQMQQQLDLEKELDDRAKNLETYMDKLKNEYYSATGNQQAILDEEHQKELDYIDSLQLNAEDKAEAISYVEATYHEKSQKLLEKTQDTADETSKVIDQVTNTLSQTLGSVFYDLASGADVTATSIINSFARVIMSNAFSQLIGTLGSSTSSGSGLLGLLSSSLGSLFSSSTTATTSTGVSVGASTAGFADTFVLHGGGSPVAGKRTRNMFVGDTDNLPRYHSGLMPDETLAVLQKNETVLTPEQLANVTNNNGSTAVNTSVNINYSGSGSKNSASKEESQKIGETVSKIVEKKILEVIQREKRTGGKLSQRINAG